MEPASIFDEMMLRGEKLRALRQLALADEEERAKLTDGNDESYESTPRATAAAPHPQDTYSPIANIEFLEEKLQKYGSSGDLTETTASSSETNTSTSMLAKGISSPSRPVLEDQVDKLPDSKLSVLRYESYLSHQRYYDDYKHSNCNFIDFPVTAEKRIIVEQQKGLGKGGLVWDAAVVLTDHLLAREAEWRREGDMLNATTTKIVDLGAGVGIAGLAIAKAMPRTEVHITDLPELMPIITRNVCRNFHGDSIVKETGASTEEKRTHTMIERGSAASDIPLNFDQGCKDLSKSDVLSLYRSANHDALEEFKTSHGTVMSKILRWGVEEDYASGPYDVVIGADVVTSLYDPEALAHTIHSLCHEDTRIYISIKNRLTELVVKFEETMRDIFSSVTVVEPISRNRNGDIIVMEAFGKQRR